MSTIGARLREWGNAEILNWLRLVPVQVFGVWKEKNEGYMENIIFDGNVRLDARHDPLFTVLYKR